MTTVKDKAAFRAGMDRVFDGQMVLVSEGKEDTKLSTKYSLKEEIDLTRHVKTPAGAKRYGKPIGTPLGGGEVKKVAKSVKKDTKVKLKPIPEPKEIKEVKATVVKAKAHAAPKKSRSVSSPPVVEVHVAAPSGSNSPAFKSSDISANDWQLSPKKLQSLIDTPNIDPARLTQLKREKAARVTKIKELLKQKGDVKDYVKENLKPDTLENPKKANIFFRGLYKIAPALKPKLEALRNSRAANKLKRIEYFEGVVDGIFEELGKTIFASALSGVASATGLGILSATGKG